MRFQATTIVALLVQFVRELDLAIAMFVSGKRRDLCPLENVSSLGHRGSRRRHGSAVERYHGQRTVEPGGSTGPDMPISRRSVETGFWANQRG